jgi:hypothetical protein
MLLESICYCQLAFGRDEAMAKEVERQIVYLF